MTKRGSGTSRTPPTQRYVDRCSTGAGGPVYDRCPHRKACLSAEAGALLYAALPRSTALVRRRRQAHPNAESAPLSLGTYAPVGNVAAWHGERRAGCAEADAADLTRAREVTLLQAVDSMVGGWAGPAGRLAPQGSRRCTGRCAASRERRLGCREEAPMRRALETAKIRHES